MSVTGISSLVSVTSRNYLPGTAVMLHSFLRTNPWFDGDILLFQDDLTDADKERLRTAFDRVSFPDISPELTQSIHTLTRSHTRLASRARRFFSLDAFAPHYSGTSLFCDGDMLFLEDISEFAQYPGALVACGDRAQIEGHGRDPHSLQENEAGSVSGDFASFNAGLMLIRPEARSPERWTEIQSQLDPESWQSVASTHTDQAVLNRVFGRDATIAAPEFNFLVGHAARLRDTNNLTAKNAKVLHFNNATKPWLFDHHAAAVSADPAIIKAYESWFAAYTAYLTGQHFRSIQG